MSRENDSVTYTSISHRTRENGIPPVRHRIKANSSLVFSIYSLKYLATFFSLKRALEENCIQFKIFEYSTKIYNSLLIAFFCSLSVLTFFYIYIRLQRSRIKKSFSYNTQHSLCSPHFLSFSNNHVQWTIRSLVVKTQGMLILGRTLGTTIIYALSFLFVLSLPLLSLSLFVSNVAQDKR